MVDIRTVRIPRVILWYAPRVFDRLKESTQGNILIRLHIIDEAARSNCHDLNLSQKQNTRERYSRLQK